MPAENRNILRAALILFLFGALVGNAFNSFHAFSGTIPVTATHINPLLDWSSYLLFGFAGLSIGMLTILIDYLFSNTPTVVSWTKALSGIGLLGIFYFTSACIFLSNNIILLILVFGFLLVFILYAPSGQALLAAVLVAIAGTSAEIYFVHTGMYYYSRPQFMGVTCWLPFLYGIASVTTGQFARLLASSGNSSPVKKP